MRHCTALLIFFVAIPGLAQVGLNTGEYYRDGRERVDAYVFRTYTDPVRAGWLLADSAVDHWSRYPHQWDYSAQSYSYRVASRWGCRIIRNTAQLGFESALHEDSRYRPSGERQFGKRVLFAISHSVLAYKPDGSVDAMYGRMAAGVVAAAASSTWHSQSMKAGSLLGGIGQAAIDRAGDNLLAE